MRVYSNVDERRETPRLLRIECDRCCVASIGPGPTIAQSGWTRHGVREGGLIFEWDYCPECSTL